MSLLPYIFDDVAISPSYHRFGSGFPNSNWVSPIERSLFQQLGNTGNYLRSNNVDGLEKQVHIGKDGFQVCLDVEHFLPNEINVKTDNHSIIVHAKHEEKKDNHGYISREFTRRYDLPKEFQPELVSSSLSSDGVLSIKCPHVPAIEGNVRHVQIQHTGPAKQCIKPNADKPAA